MRLALIKLGKERKGPVDNALLKAFDAEDASIGSYSVQITPFSRNFEASFAREGELDDSATTATLPLANLSGVRTPSRVLTTSVFGVVFQVVVFFSPVPVVMGV